MYKGNPGKASKPFTRIFTWLLVYGFAKKFEITYKSNVYMLLS